MKQIRTVLVDNLELEDVIKGPATIDPDGVHIRVERDVEIPSDDWHPLVPKIINVMCASDPENGGFDVGDHLHSHDPNTGECYWAYNVGPKIAEVLAGEEPAKMTVSRGVVMQTVQDAVNSARFHPYKSGEQVLVQAVEALLAAAGVEVTP